MTAAEVWREVAERRISLTPAFDGRVWTASVDEKGAARHNRNRALRSVSATSSTPIGAVRALVEKLDGGEEEGPRW